MIFIGKASSTAGPTGERSQRRSAAPIGQSAAPIGRSAAAGRMASAPSGPGQPTGPGQPRELDETREPGGLGGLGGLGEPGGLGGLGEPGGLGKPRSTQSPAQQHSACRRVAVIVDDDAESAPALRQAAAQARQRNATLDVICLVPADADTRAVTMARVRLGELSRRACPYGMGAPVRLRVEHGDLDTVLPAIRAGVELLVPGPGIVADQTAPGPASRPPAASCPPAASRRGAQPGRGTWLHTLLQAIS